MKPLRCLAALTMALVGCAHGAGRKGDLAVPMEQGVVERHVHGLTILVKRIPHEQLVAAQLYLRGGVRNWTGVNAGVERLALATAIAGGTLSLPKEAFAGKLGALGSQLASESDNDFSVVAAKSLVGRWRPTLDLLADAVLHPALPPGEIELQRQLQLSALRQEQEEPDALLSLMSSRLLYEGLPYANRSIGSPRSVSNLTRDDLLAQLSKLRETSRWLLVVVGDVSPEEISAWAEARFGAVPEGDYKEAPLSPKVFSKPRLEVVIRPLPTNYVLAAFPAPSWRDPEMPVAAVAMSSIKEKLFEEVRTKRELSYAPSAGLAPRGLGEGYLYVTAVKPNETLQVMLDVVRAFQRGAIDPQVLEGDKRLFLTRFLMRSESTDGQGELLARAELLGGDWRLSGTLLDRIKKVTPAEVSAFATKYVKDLQTVVLGPATGLDKALFGSL